MDTSGGPLFLLGFIALEFTQSHMLLSILDCKRLNLPTGLRGLWTQIHLAGEHDKSWGNPSLCQSWCLQL